MSGTGMNFNKLGINKFKIFQIFESIFFPIIALFVVFYVNLVHFIKIMFIGGIILWFVAGTAGWILINLMLWWLKSLSGH